MVSKIERVLRQALTTFSDSCARRDFHDNFTKLQQNIGELDAQSVGLDPRLLRCDQYELLCELLNRRPPSEPGRCQVPITYIRIFENELMSVSVFVLRDGAEIPLHNHPCMHGLLKVIHGKVKIQSYTPSQKDCSRLKWVLQFVCVCVFKTYFSPVKIPLTPAICWIAFQKNPCNETGTDYCRRDRPSVCVVSVGRKHSSNRRYRRSCGICRHNCSAVYKRRKKTLQVL